MQFQSVKVCIEGIRCSGLLFDSEWILTHGNILGDCSLKDLELVSSRLSLPAFKVPPVLVVLQERTPRSAHCAGVWRCPLIADAMDKLLREWMFGNGTGDDDTQMTKTLLPILVLLRLGSSESPRVLPNEARALSALKTQRLVLTKLLHYLDTLPPPQRGHKLVIKSTPFGSHFFLDSWSPGILSNIGGPQGCVLLTDARTAPGCEGGPIFRQGEGAGLVGLVISSLCWWRGEWIGFTLGAALGPLLRQQVAENPSLTPSLLASHLDLPACVDNGVVLVRCGTAWGSGVVLDEEDGLILTCSHVLRQAPRGLVTVYHKDSSLRVEVVYRTKEGMPFDLGIVRAGPNSRLKNIRLSDTPPIKGEPVLAAGFPLISDVESSYLLPLVTRGHVSHVAPTMLQTTCCIQSGASGGAILRPSGELLGLIACNARDTTNHAVYPHFNLCIQMATVKSVLDRYLQSKDPAVLRGLECKDVAIQRLWALKHMPGCKL